MKSQIPRQPTSALVNICLDILESIDIKDPERMLNRIKLHNSSGRRGYKTSELDRTSDACAFGLRDLNHVPCCGGKISFLDIACLLGYRGHSSVTAAIKRHTVYVDGVTKEDPQAQERASYVDKLIQERRKAPLQVRPEDLEAAAETSIGEIEDVCPFNYQGRKAVIQRQTIISNPNSNYRYWILMSNGDKMYAATLIADDGTKVSVCNSRFVVRDSEDNLVASSTR